ncbi:hypothetical protein [Winogradskyella sp.]|uniref:hypothetical protein n=1 Tax=Winogradskyella sp. TaxID=1883156 RepID=UPI003BABF025
MENQYVRYPSGISEEKLSKRLGLYWDKDIQDWELIVSDSGRIRDFIKVYQNELDNDDDKFTLMALIVSSFDDIAPNFDKDNSQLWDVCKTILKKECYLHYATIVYWCLLENEPGNVFPISLLMRDVWEEVKYNFI